MPDKPDIFNQNITGDIIRKAAIKDGSGLSGMDADDWRRLFTLNYFEIITTDLCDAFSAVVRKLCTTQDDSDTLEGFLSYRLSPLDKNPGLQLIGVDEVLRRIAGKPYCQC